MQTLEEKKAILQRAIDKGLEVAYQFEQVCATTGRCWLDWSAGRKVEAFTDKSVCLSCAGYMEVHPIKTEFAIVKPRITADDLAEAIEQHEQEWKDGRADQKLYDLAKRYREQEAGE